MNYKIKISILFLFILIIAVGCGSDTNGDVIDIVVTPASFSIVNGDIKDLSTIIYIEKVNQDGSKSQILVDECRFTVNNIAILEIVGGKITGKSKGTTGVDITYSGLTKSITVNVL